MLDLEFEVLTSGYTKEIKHVLIFFEAENKLTYII